MAPFIIRNTFIDVDETVQSSSSKRSTSLPPKLGSFDGSTVAAGSSFCADDTSLLGDDEFCKSYPGQSWLSGGSTSDQAPGSPASSSSPWSTSSNDGLDNAGLAFHLPPKPPPAEVALDWPTGTPAPSRSRATSVIIKDRIAEPIPEGKVRVALSLCAHIPEKDKAKLKKTAAAFVPTFAHAVQTPEVDTVISAARMQLLLLAQVSDVQVVGTQRGNFSLVCEVVSCDPVERAAVLSAAQEALLKAAACSRGTYVLGYLASPFEVVSKDGFRATLAVLEDSSASVTCWEQIEKGACPRRSSCRWCHPPRSSMRRVYVNLK